MEILTKKDHMAKKIAPPQHVHILGIGGSGMSAIARVLLGKGFVVSGSDRAESDLTQALAEAGATVYIGHEASQVVGVDILLMSSAIGMENVEVVAAVNAGIQIYKRAEFLGKLMSNDIGIAVAGTHGKTTTTGMIAHVLLGTGQDPTVVVGGVLPVLGSNGRAGQGDAFVIEADEYDHMFLGLRPTIGIVTNIEHDHPDIYPTAEEYVGAFREFAGLLPANGTLIACHDDPAVLALVNGLTLADVQILTYGLSDQRPTTNDQHMLALDLRSNQLGGTDFLVQLNGDILGIARLAVPGAHNVSNALAAIAVALQLEVPFARIVKALAGFTGMGRRFEIIGEANGVTIVDDYAHHPTEIVATLAAARQRFPQAKIWAVWQPHTFSRTKMLMKEFAGSFHDANEVIVLDIYRSRETDTLGIGSADVVAKMKQAQYIPTREGATAFLAENVVSGDVVLTLGAGDSNEIGRWLYRRLQDG
jgi:UDP-N-acetylmuramate--alanine ligase